MWKIAANLSPFGYSSDIYSYQKGWGFANFAATLIFFFLAGYNKSSIKELMKMGQITNQKPQWAGQIVTATYNIYNVNVALEKYEKKWIRIIINYCDIMNALVFSDFWRWFLDRSNGQINLILIYRKIF